MSQTQSNWQWFGLVWPHQLDLALDEAPTFDVSQSQPKILHPHESYLTKQKAFVLCNHLFIHSKWVKHNLIGNGWVWFGPTSLIWLWMKGPQSMYLSPKCYIMSHIWQSKKLLSCAIIFLYIPNESNTILLAMIGSGLAPPAWFGSGWRADIPLVDDHLSQYISAQNATSWVISDKTKSFWLIQLSFYTFQMSQTQSNWQWFGLVWPHQLDLVLDEGPTIHVCKPKT